MWQDGDSRRDIGDIATAALGMADRSTRYGRSQHCVDGLQHYYGKSALFLSVRWVETCRRMPLRSLDDQNTWKISAAFAV